MMSAGIAAGLVSVLVALPPPLCRGKRPGQYDSSLDRRPSERARAEVQAAYQALCPEANCGQGDVFQNPTIGNNAVTWVSGLRDGEQTRAKIVYSPNFLNILASKYGPGASFGVLAHEVGHHLTAAWALRQRFESSWNEELRADYLAGCALGRNGRASGELENALKALAAVATPSHPSFARRVPVVRRGFRDCQAQAERHEKSKKRFGLGTVLSTGRGAKRAGCWRYAYRLPDEVARIGPVAAPRRQSKYFKSKRNCERHRLRFTKESLRVTELCRCG